MNLSFLDFVLTDSQKKRNKEQAGTGWTLGWNIGLLFAKAIMPLGDYQNLI